MDIDTAINFVNTHGNPIEKARLQYVLTSERPSKKVIAQLFADQRPDGGWSAFWAKDYTSLDATCYHLAQAEQLGLTKAEPAILHALIYLAQRQAPDGSWEEDSLVVGLAPLWTKPGDLHARLYLTANCGLWLALLGGNLDQVELSAGYLQIYLNPNGRLPGFLHTHWLAGGLWRKLGWREPTGRVCAYLSRQINDFAISNLSWLITTLSKAGFPAIHPLLDQAATRLEQSQNDDGFWPSEDGPDQDVHATLEALLALQLCGRELNWPEF